MRPELAASPLARERFLREARAAAAVRHDHVVTVFHADADRGVPFLAMELLEGETLEARLRRHGRLRVAEVLRLGREVAEGLKAAHARGLVHRDIKPANIWLEREDDRVRLLDFGLARAVSSGGNLTETGAVVGTPSYMAPEQAGGEPVDQRCDLFSLGGVLYAACTGRPPFPGGNRSAILKAVLNEQPPPPRDLNPMVPAALSDLVMRLLAKEAGLRPASAQQVVDAVRAIEGKTALLSSHDFFAGGAVGVLWALAAALLVLGFVCGAITTAVVLAVVGAIWMIGSRNKGLAACATSAALLTLAALYLLSLAAVDRHL
jgi:serine/threonine protein kinase